MSMRSGGRAEPASPGMALSHAACGPACERSMAWAGGCKAGSNSVSRKWVEQAREPWCCQPWHLSPGSGRSHCAGRKPLCMSCQEGRPRQPAASSRRPAASAARRQAAAAAGPAASSARHPAASGRRACRTGNAFFPPADGRSAPEICNREVKTMEFCSGSVSLFHNRRHATTLLRHLGQTQEQ